MVFTAAQLDNFFLNGPQMGLTPAVRTRLAQEGLVTIDDFQDFKEDQLLQAYKNMRTTIPGVPGIPAIPPILVPACCSLR